MRSRARARVGAAVAVFLVVFLSYREAPVTGASDAHYTVLESVALLDGHGLDVTSYLPRPLDPFHYPGMKQPRDRDGLPYQLTEVDGRLVPYYPPGTAVLSAPLVALMRPLGYGPFDAQGRYDPFLERRTMKHLAFFVAALFVVFAFLIAAELLPLGWAFILALAVAFATPAWSTTSRSLWSHDWLIVLVAAAIWLLVRGERRGRPPSAVALATLTAWGFFVRPTGALVVVALGVYIYLRSPREGVRYGITALLWGGGFVAWSWATYGTVVPPYMLAHAMKTGGWSFVTGLAGILVSPSRGLLVFCPWILWVVWLLWRYRGTIRSTRWVAFSAAVTMAHLPVVAASRLWWGGYSYGPRLLVDVLPWLVLVAVLALDARRRAVATRGRKVETLAGMAAVVLSVALHAPGALSQQTHEWNDQPVSVNRDVHRLWSWSDPQFLAWRELRR